MHDIMLELLKTIDEEIEQRKHGGNDEDWSALQALSDRGHAVLRVDRRSFPEDDHAVSLTGYEWTALLARIVKVDALSEFGRQTYRTAAHKLQKQLGAASDSYRSADRKLPSVFDA